MITLTDAAVAHIKLLLEREDAANLKLRLFVTGGGCSGFKYSFTFDEIINEDDIVTTKDDISLLVDAISFQYLDDATIDYEETLQSSQFVIKNPNSTKNCGCGKSFSV
jgi:iron-sulfur cluster insertion protein